MASTAVPNVLDDPLAASLAQAVAGANQHVRSLGIDPEERILSVSEVVSGGELSWRVAYLPREHVSRRGGELIVDVDFQDGSIRQVLRGQ